MLKITSVISAFLFLFFLGAALLYLLNFSPNNHSIERIFSTEQIKTRIPNKQEKTDISKDLFISEKGQRLHHSITSPRSILSTYPKGKNLDLIENMFDMKCYLEEQVCEEGNLPKKQIRLIESKEGSYSYTNQQFNAPFVSFSLFESPHNEEKINFNPETSLLRGTAKTVSLSFINHNANFHANQLKGHVHTSQGALK